MCLQPKYITNRTLHYDLFKPLKFAVPCGKCEECKQVNRNEWFCRAYYEWLKNSRNNTFFYTLTYNNENLPMFMGHQRFSKRHIQLFMKRLRKELQPYNIKCRYIFTCEFGEKHGRCHYHCLLFLDGSFNPYQFYKLIQKCWSYGFVKYGRNVGLVDSVQGIQYVTKYVTKDYSHLDEVLPVFAPLVFKRYYALFNYVCRRWTGFPPITITMNKDYTFSRKLLDRCSPEQEEFVQKFLTKMRRIISNIVPFHLQSSRLGSSIVEYCNKDLEQVPILKSNGKVDVYKLPRYIRRLLWYDCIEGENSHKHDTFVLNEEGKKHFLTKLEIDLTKEVQNLQFVCVTASKLEESLIPFLKERTSFEFNHVRDIVYYCQHFDLDFEVFALYRKLFRGRVCTFDASYLNAQFVKDNWYDYARACMYDCCKFDFGKITDNYALQKTLSQCLFNNTDFFQVYEQATQIFDVIIQFQNKCRIDAQVQKEKDVRNLRQLLNNYY